MLVASATALWERYGRFLHEVHRIPLQTLSLYRIAFALYLLVMSPIPSLRWIAGYPVEFHDPAPGLMYLWSGFPSLPVLVALEVVVVVTTCALAIGWRTAWTSVALTVSGLLANSVFMSFGKIDHTAVLWFLPALMSASGWGAYWSYDRWVVDNNAAPRIPVGSGLRPEYLVEPGGGREGGWPRSPGLPVALVGAMLGVAFLTSALPKVASGWLSFNSSGSQAYFRSFYFALNRNQLLAEIFINLSWAPAWELVDWATVALELSMGVSLLWTVVHRWAMFSAWMFHVGVMLIMNIPFFGPTPLYPLFFLTLIDPSRAERVGRWMVQRWWLLVPLLVPLAAGALLGDGLYSTVLVDWLGASKLMVEFTYFAVGMVALVLVGAKSRGFTRVF